MDIFFQNASVLQFLPALNLLDDKTIFGLCDQIYYRLIALNTIDLHLVQLFEREISRILDVHKYIYSPLGSNTHTQSK
jgi:hypothetical protein